MAVILETERLLFRDHEPEDLEPFCVMEADPEVRRFVGGAPRSRERAEAKFRQVYLQPVPDRMALWATVYKPEEQYIGYCGIYPHFDEKGSGIPREGVLAFYLARPYWGRGLATEAGRAFLGYGFRFSVKSRLLYLEATGFTENRAHYPFLRFGFDQLGLSRIIATVQIGNDASVSVLEKLGLSRVGTQIGELRSFYFYEITPQAWTASLV